MGPLSVQETGRLHTEYGLTAHQISLRCNLTTAGVRNRLKRLGVYTPRLHGQNTLAVGQHIDDKGYVQESVNHSWPFYEQMARKPVSSKRKYGKVLQHRRVMADSLGRALTPYETVHHLDGHKQNNQIENLQLRQGRHGKGITYRCNCCSSYDVICVEI